MQQENSYLKAPAECPQGCSSLLYHPVKCFLDLHLFLCLHTTESQCQKYYVSPPPFLINAISQEPFREFFFFFKIGTNGHSRSRMSSNVGGERSLWTHVCPIYVNAISGRQRMQFKSFYWPILPVIDQCKKKKCGIRIKKSNIWYSHILIPWNLTVFF